MRKRRRNDRMIDSKAAKLRAKRLMKIAVFVVAAIAILFIGVFVAAQQQFNKLHFSRDNAKLRRQIEVLEGEKDKLISQREMASSVSELKRSARKTGLIDTARPIEITVAKPKNDAGPQHTAARKSYDGSVVVKTSMVTKSDKQIPTVKEAERSRIAVVKPATAAIK